MNRDLEFSLNFMRELLEIRPELRLRLEQDHAEVEEENDGHIPTRSCECGAGIGRVTKGLLLDLGMNQLNVINSKYNIAKISLAFHFNKVMFELIQTPNKLLLHTKSLLSYPFINVSPYDILIKQDLKNVI